MATGRKTGGRVKGTPNKPKNPIMQAIMEHNTNYFCLKDEDGLSQFDIDCEALTPMDRANIEVKLLEYHQPKMKSVDMTVSGEFSMGLSIEDNLRELYEDEEDEE